MEKRYRMYGDFLREKYGQKVYKLPIQLPVTCPNRDGSAGQGGCIFCGEVGAGFENLDTSIPVRKQLLRNREYIGSKYHAEKFIAYFQNYTNTYMPLHTFRNVLQDACCEGVVGIALSTRPDCIHPSYLDTIREIADSFGIDPYIELGLQTVNYHTLKRINRGHGLAEFIDSVSQIKKYGFNICTHMILNLPWDNMEDVVENARVLSALGVDQVKLHALYIMGDTELGRLYQEESFEMITKEEYIGRVVTFLQYLDPRIVIQRLIGRAPAENSLFVNWGTSWWKIRDEIESALEAEGIRQGSRFDYLGGSRVRQFL